MAGKIKCSAQEKLFRTPVPVIVCSNTRLPPFTLLLRRAKRLRVQSSRFRIRHLGTSKAVGFRSGTVQHEINKNRKEEENEETYVFNCFLWFGCFVLFQHPACTAHGAGIWAAAVGILPLPGSRAGLVPGNGPRHGVRPEGAWIRAFSWRIMGILSLLGEARSGLGSRHGAKIRLGIRLGSPQGVRSYGAALNSIRSGS